MKALRTVLSTALLAALLAWPAWGGSSGLPVALAGSLPPRLEALAALDASPAVRRARAEQAAAEARAAARLRGPHEWTLEGQIQRRDAGIDGRFLEWEASLQRTFRLPGKANVDRQMAEAERALGIETLADARHAAAIGLLESWIEWLAASELAAQRNTAAEIAARDLAAARQRYTEGDLPAAALDAATAADAQAARAAQEALLREQEAAIALSTRFPAIVLPTPPPRLPPPAEGEPDWQSWAERAATVSHALALARRRAELILLAAERARRDTRADPTIGLRTLSERGAEEKALGVFFSIPLGQGARGHLADEQTANADAGVAEADATRRDIGLQARTLARRAQLLTQAWRLAQVSAVAHGDEARRLSEGHTLGGVELADLLAARRRASEAATAEVEARAAAFSAAARLLLDAHAYWQDDDAEVQPVDTRRRG